MQNAEKETAKKIEKGHIAMILAEEDEFRCEF